MAKKNRKKEQHEAPKHHEPKGEAASTSMVGSVKQAGAAMVESLRNPSQLVQSVRESVNTAADAVDRTLAAVKAALETADDKVAQAQEWTAEKVERIEATLTTLRETVAAAGQLVDATKSRARALTGSADEALRASGEAAAAAGKRALVARDELGAEHEPELEITGSTTRDAALAPETGTPLDADDGADTELAHDIDSGRHGGDPRNGGDGLL